RSRTRDVRRFNLRELMVLQHAAGRAVGCGAQAQSIALSLTAQVQVAVAQAYFLADFAGGRWVIDLEWQCCRPIQHLKLSDIEFNLTRSQVRVLRTFWASFHNAGELHDELRAQLVRLLSDLRLAEYGLCETRTVTQVDEDNATVVTTSGNPTSQGYCFSS